MPKAILEFDLPEENEAYKNAVKGIDFYCAIFDIYNYLRSKYKYEDLPDAEHDTITEVYEKFFDILKDNEVDL